MKITKQMVMDLGPCAYYYEARIDELLDGRSWINTRSVLTLEIPKDDKLWLLNHLMTQDQRREFARRCALDVIDKWDATDVVIEYLETGNEELRSAAWAAARSAAMSSALGAAWGAARSSALAAARAAAWDAAWDAARSAARSAARAATWDADLDAAMDKYLGWCVDYLDGK